jgi:hypothetical protein
MLSQDTFNATLTCLYSSQTLSLINYQPVFTFSMLDIDGMPKDISDLNGDVVFDQTSGSLFVYYNYTD